MSIGNVFWPFARTIGSLCIIGSTAGGALAAAVQPSPQSPDVAGVTVIQVSRDTVEIPRATFATRFDFVRPTSVGDVLTSAAWHAPLSGTAKAREPRYAAVGDVINGAASMYNPGDPTDKDSGDMNMASGERYDADGWTAAIRTDLRDQFGGVRYGKNYRPS